MRLPGSGRFDQDIVGEQHYQDALIKIAGPYTDGGRRMRCDAKLYLQPDNPHDPNAIRVEIDNMTVGYISREEAPILRQQLRQIGVYPGQRVAVSAAIGGGRPGTRYGVYLDFDIPDSAPAPDLSPAPPTIKPTKHGAGVTTGWIGEDEAKLRSPSRLLNAETPLVWPKESQPEPKRKSSGWPWWVWLLLLAGIAFLFLRGCGSMESAQAPRASTPALSNTMWLHCPDCAEIGMEANIWSDANLTRRVCTLNWGDPVKILDRSSVNYGMARVRNGNCEGWIRTSLLR